MLVVGLLAAHCYERAGAGVGDRPSQRTTLGKDLI
jgi:hypothetical protein